jgi:hypothetical protein
MFFGLSIKLTYPNIIAVRRISVDALDSNVYLDG